MPRPSRLLGTALAVVLAAAPSVRAADPDKLLPADAELVVSINVRQVLESEIIKKYALEQMKQTLQGSDAQKVLRELGLDPLKDVTKVVVGASGTPGDPNDARGLLIVRGKFDPDKLYKAAEAQTKKDGDHFTLVKDGSDVMFKYQPDNGNPVFGTVVDDGAVVLGTEKKLVSAALAAASANKKPALKGEVANLVGRMDDKVSVWVVAATKDKLNKLPMPGGPGADLAKQLPNLDNATISVRVGNDVNLDVSLGLKDEPAADEMLRQLDDLLSQGRGFLSLAAAGDPKMKPLVDFVKSIKTGAKGKNVTITATMTGDAIGKLVNQGE